MLLSHREIEQKPSDTLSSRLALNCTWHTMTILFMLPMVPEKQEENALYFTLCEFTFLLQWSTRRFAMKTIKLFAPKIKCLQYQWCTICSLQVETLLCWFGQIGAETCAKWGICLVVPLSLLLHPGPRSQWPCTPKRRDTSTRTRLVPLLQLSTILCHSEPTFALHSSGWSWFIHILFKKK